MNIEQELINMKTSEIEDLKERIDSHLRNNFDKVVVEKLEDFLKSNTNIESFYFETYSEGDDEGGSYIALSRVHLEIPHFNGEENEEDFEEDDYTEEKKDEFRELMYGIDLDFYRPDDVYIKNPYYRPAA